VVSAWIGGLLIAKKEKVSTDEELAEIACKIK
jgi:hypothetical protein